MLTVPHNCSATGPQAGIDMAHLEKTLLQYSGRRLILGAFTAASNLTGAVTDMDAVTALLHQYGALACWDCATAAPHIKIDMNPPASGPHGSLVYKVRA